MVRVSLPLLYCAFSVAAIAQPAGVVKAFSVEGVTEYRLANGLRAVLFPDPSKATITVNIVYLAGSRHENYGETGMAHILEHLVSYGSTRHPDAKAEQTDRGASRNASTSFDRTNYYETFPATAANLDWALDLEADRMRNAIIRKDILDSQMTVVRNEYEAGENSPQRVLFQRVYATAFLWHNYGKSTIGARSDIENVPVEKIRAFYDRYYHPNNAVLIVTGKFDEAEAVKLIARKFGPVPRSAHPIPSTYTAEPVQDGERHITLRRVGDLQSLMAAYHVPAAAHPDAAAVAVLVNALTGQPHGRLYKALVPTKKAASVSGMARGLREPGLALIEASVRKETPLEEVRAIVIRALDSLAAEPVTEEELERSKASMLRQIELGMNDSTGVAMMLTEAAAAGDWRLLFHERDRIRKTAAADVARAARTYFVPSNRTIGMYLPEEKPVRAEISAAPDPEVLLKGYTGDQAASAGEAFDPSPGNIEKRTQRGRLSSGMRYALLPKQTRGGSVHMTLALHFGDAASLAGRSLEGQLAAAMLMRGTARRTRQQIEDELNRLKSRIVGAGAAGSVSAQIQTVRASALETLRLAAEILRSPSFPASEFDQLRETWLAAAENSRREPQSMAGLAMGRHLVPYPAGDPRATMTSEERIALLPKLTVEAVRRFHADFYGASDAELVAVGDFDEAAVRSLAEELFGGWKSPRPYAALARDAKPSPAVRSLLEAPDKSNAMFVAGLVLPVRDTDPDYPALQLANYMLGGHSTSRLYLRIRGKEGLSYGVGSAVVSTARDSFSLFQGFAIANPQNVPKVEAAFREEMERAAREGFSAEEVAKAKTSWLEARRVQRSQDASLVQQLQLLMRDGRTAAWTAEQEKKVEALSPQEVSEAFRRRLPAAQLSIVAAGDFKKAGVTQ